MTREELKVHCKKQIEMCEFWAIGKGEKPSGKVYEEHKLILELLEQEPKTGHWISLEYDGYADGNPVWDKWECSECGWEHSGDEESLTAFCPNCGAKMVEPQESEG